MPDTAQTLVVTTAGCGGCFVLWVELGLCLHSVGSAPSCASLLWLLMEQPLQARPWDTLQFFRGWPSSSSTPLSLLC